MVIKIMLFIIIYQSMRATVNELAIFNFLKLNISHI